MTKPNTWLTVSAALALTATIASSGWAQKPPPKDELIRGTWGFSAAGMAVAPDASAPTLVAAVGLITFAPDTPECVIHDRVNTGGVFVFRTSESCTYALAPDGRGAIVAGFANESEFESLQFVLVRKGREMRFIRKDAVVLEGVAQRQ